MAEARKFYNKLELTIKESDERFTQFGRDVDELLQRYQDLIIGYDLEDLDGDVYHCYDDNYERSEPRLREVYGFE
jgi:hypothetical protein